MDAHSDHSKLEEFGDSIYNELDPALFDDPIKLLKWLESKEDASNSAHALESEPTCPAKTTTRKRKGRVATVSYDNLLDDLISLDNFKTQEEGPGCYYNWLNQRAGGNNKEDFISAYAEVEKIALKYGLIHSPLLHILDVTIIQNLQSQLIQKKEFRMFDPNLRYTCGLALRHYEQYLLELNDPEAKQANDSKYIDSIHELTPTKCLTSPVPENSTAFVNAALTIMDAISSEDIEQELKPDNCSKENSTVKINADAPYETLIKLREEQQSILHEYTGKAGRFSAQKRKAASARIQDIDALLEQKRNEVLPNSSFKPTKTMPCAHASDSACTTLKLEAEQKRVQASQKRSMATQKRDTARQLAKAAEEASTRSQNKHCLARQLLLEAIRQSNDNRRQKAVTMCYNAANKRLIAVFKRILAKKQRCEANYLARQLSIANSRKLETRSACVEYNLLVTEAKSREHARQAEIAKLHYELELQFQSSLEKINIRYNLEKEIAENKLAAVRNQIDIIDCRIASLNILRIIEKKKLQKERSALLIDETHLIDIRKTIDERFCSAVSTEKQNYEAKRASVEQQIPEQGE